MDRRKNMKEEIMSGRKEEETKNNIRQNNRVKFTRKEGAQNNGLL